ncbi:MAG: sn-glycerol-3-phosphate ABC transporter permease UgpA [Rhodobacteraceae bacterium]|jgi:sn-glycerol 3-phosphate transport system permease protein|nr:sn-glycerol-3-phosphate ABC transporter permease UgpA [Paracoccaceae bacterium]
MEKRVFFRDPVLPYLLVAPQIVITVVFFLWPSYQALESALYVEDAFGFSRQFVGLDNFRAIFADKVYLRAFGVTLVFGLSVTVLTMALSLGLAVAADRVLRASTAYRTFLIWPYAVAPAIAGVLWYFMMNPTIGIVAYWIEALSGTEWNHYVNGNQALILVIIAATWKQISYNFLFFLAGLQSIPRALVEAAAIDRAGPARRFWTIIFPLLAPTTFFLLVVNLVYAFFDTFSLIDATTNGGPANATSTLVVKVYQSGFVGQDYGASAAQSVVLMVIVMAMTVLQFRYIDRRVNY